MKRLFFLPLFFCLAGILFLSAVRYYRSANSAAAVVKTAPERVYAYCAVPDRAALDFMTDTTQPLAPKLQGLGDYHWAVATAVPEAQAFFNQGIRLYYGFNHLEAYRAFREAARLDPSCAMAWWGQALSLGPNINAPMDPADAGKVADAVGQAIALQDKASPKEKALISAIAKRYVADPPADRRPLDEAYAAAMKAVQQQFPQDPDVAALYAEAIMDLHPWDYWLKDGTPQPWTPEIIQQLEAALAMSTDHPGAHHFYIHAVEASPNPGKAMASANRLRTLMPNAGHLVHMPAHIYIRTGLYHEGSLTNEASIKADLAYLTECNSQGLYALMYHPHNYHFLWACATLEGRGEKAMEAAMALQSKSDTSMMLSAFGYIIQQLYCTPVFAMVRFGKWDSLLQMPPPDKDWKFVTAMWRYGRGTAYARKGQLSEAAAEADAITALRNDTTLKSIETGARNSAYIVMEIAENVVRGEIAAGNKDYPAAVERLTAAMQLEDKLLYNEPVDWHHPVREILGDVLLQSKQYELAEKYYQEDLASYPESGWALMGLYQSLKAQGKAHDAAVVKERYDKAFSRADIRLTASRI